MELTKKCLTVSSPGTCLHKSFHQFHSAAHTGDSSLDLLVFFHHEELLSYLHCAHWLPFWGFVDEFPSLAFLKWWFMIFLLFCQLFNHYHVTFQGRVEDCVPILMENFALNTLPQSVASWKKADLLDCSPIFNWVELFWTWTEWTPRAKKKSKPFSCLP